MGGVVLSHLLMYCTGGQLKTDVRLNARNTACARGVSMRTWPYWRHCTRLCPPLTRSKVCMQHWNWPRPLIFPLDEVASLIVHLSIFQYTSEAKELQDSFTRYLASIRSSIPLIWPTTSISIEQQRVSSYYTATCAYYF